MCCFYKNIKYLMFFILFSLVYLLPPFQSPDEFAHYCKSYSLLKFNFFEPVVSINQSLHNFMNNYESIPFHRENKVSNQNLNNTQRLKWNDFSTEVNRGILATNIYLPIIYIPQSIAIATGKILNLKIDKTYKLGRFINIILCLVILSVAFNIHKPSITTLAIIFTPMTLFQMSYTTPDGLLFTLVVLIFSLIKKIMEEEGINYELLLILSLSIITFCGHRLYCVPFLIIPSFILASKKELKKSILFFVSLVGVFVAWLLLYKSNVHETIKDGYTLYYKGTYYLTNISETLKIIFNTLTDEGKLHFYWRSFFGQLGWLDYNIPSNALYILTFLLVTLFVFELKLKNNIRRNVILFMLVLSSLVLIFLALLIQWTPFPNATIVEGIQGRYFIPIALTISCLFTKNLEEYNIDSKYAQYKINSLKILFYIYLLVSYSSIIQSSLLRYYIG